MDIPRLLARPARRCWGATCVAAPVCVGRRCLIGGLIGLALLLPLLTTRHVADQPEPPVLPAAAENAPSDAAQPRQVSLVRYEYPEGAALCEITCDEITLLRGKLLLIDEAHPVPSGAPAPNTLRIATCGRGMIPVRDLALKSAQETIDALYQLFYDARRQQIEGLAVCRATLSEAEQRAWLLERMRVYAERMPLGDALAAAQKEVDEPGRSEHQQGYAVDIRLYASWNAPAADAPLLESEQGRYLLQHAWRHGFVLRYPKAAQEDKAYHFRYVGEAHSTAMTYLDLTLEGYLNLLHEKGVIQVLEGGAPKFVIVCAPIVDGYAALRLPEGAKYDISADNLGYAIAACSYP